MSICRNSGTISADDKTVTVKGWVQEIRNLGGISFVILRDASGTIQVTLPKKKICPELYRELTTLPRESVVAVTGDVKASDQTELGVEIIPASFELYSKAEVPLPMGVIDKVNVEMDTRLNNRFMDLRRPEIRAVFELKSMMIELLNEAMVSNGFSQVFTPKVVVFGAEGGATLFKVDYFGNDAYLAQSPQLYKQMLMVSGFDRYFQLARCYRDEDARGDRQPEFTQIDIEMSFVGREDVLALAEGLMAHVFKKALNVELPSKFRRLSYEEAMESYGTDKPDLRFDLTLKDFSPWALAGDFQAFKEALSAGGAVKALVVPGKIGDRAVEYSRKQIEELEAHAKIYKARGLAWMRVGEGSTLEGGVSKFFASQAEGIASGLGAGPGDLVLLLADGKRKVANTALGAVRSKLGRDLGLCDPGPGGSPKFEFVHIVDFPLFEFDEEAGRWEAAHHMFSFPQEKYHELLEKDPGAVKGDLYDIVLNGYELASGSIRIHDPELQKRIFKVVGFDPVEAESKFGFLTEAFKYGAPPHGGIAFGFDRLAMIMAGEASIKEVIAFPKNSFAEGLMDDSPNAVSPEQVKELHLKIEEPPDNSK